MGKIKKIKEQKKIEAQENAIKRKEKTKGFVKIFIALVVIGLIFIGYMFLNKENQEIEVGTGGESIVKNEVQEKVGVLETNLGIIKFKMFSDVSPKTVVNFETLASQDFYNGVKFHRIISDFMIQTGDPNSKDDDWSNDGTGGPGYAFEDEFNDHKLVRGSIAMANSGPNTNGSQFFIVTAESTPWLDGKHTNFGEVIEGMDIVEQIERVAVDENDHPLEDIVIFKAYVE